MVHQERRDVAADHQPTQAEHPRIVGPDGALGGVGIGHGCRADAVDLVGHDGHAQAGAADEDGTLHLAGCHGSCHRLPDLGIVDVLVALDAEVDDLVSLRRCRCALTTSLSS